MIKKLIFENYKAFPGRHEIEIRPFTLLIGKNSSGKSSITHLLSMMGNLLGRHTPTQYRSFSSNYISLYSFHNLFTTGLRLGAINDKDDELGLTFVWNLGKLYLHKVEIQSKGRVYSQEFSSEVRQEVSDNVDFVAPILEDWGFGLSDWAYSSSYLGPIRTVLDSVRAFNASNVGDLKSKGENVFDILIDSFKNDKILLNQVSEWLAANMDGQRLNVENLVADFYSIDVDNGRGASVPVEEVGEGVSQVLPVIVQSYMENRADISIIEQPALHLHPAAHASVADRLIESIVLQGKRYIVESHSANVLLALRRAVANPDVKLTSKDVVVYYIDAESENPISSIEISDNGELSSWPTGVFGEGSDLLRDILRMRK